MQTIVRKVLLVKIMMALCLALLPTGTSQAALGEWTWMSPDAPTPWDEEPTYGTQGTAEPANQPGARTGSISWTDQNGDLWLFSGSGRPNDLWRYEPDANLWTWLSGDNDTLTDSATYGTKGTADSANVPGARSESISWTDKSGDLWLFGGKGYDSDNNWGRLNDLWRYEPDNGDNGTWTWMSGDNQITGSFDMGTYGTKGTADPANIPRGRYSSISWTDDSGNLWLFGGYISTLGQLNDLWRYNPDTNMWTWMSGSNTENQVGVYGTKGTPAAANVPGARHDSISWTDSSGNFWLFGGWGFASTDIAHFLNDLWCYNPDTNLWTWISGSNMSRPTGVYGTKGTPSAANIPGGRNDSISWIDKIGNLWLFGGGGYDSTTDNGMLSDLWRYEPDTDLWTWMSGDNETTFPAGGIYGTKGIANSDNAPGHRDQAISWTDSNGDLWFFGGQGIYFGGTSLNYNDLWRYEATQCLENGDCSDGFCVASRCVACTDNSDCDNTLYCDGTETCDNNTGACTAGTIPCAGKFCDETADSCQECVADDDCFGGVCINNLCIECANDTDCDNGLYCDGTETCDNNTGACITSTIPCAGEFCDETADSCQECVANDDCFGGICVNNLCAECTNNTDCNNGEYCDGTETCNGGVCVTSNIPCAGEFCDETADSCQECVGDDDCFGGVCINNLCAECANNTDCDNGKYCDGTETCNGGICETSNIPCASKLCDETADSCRECVGNDDCFGSVCANNLCVECANNTDCDNGEYCDGTETCNGGVCETSNIPCASKFCDETADSCQECVGDDDCFGGVCVNNLCAECANNTDCDNGAYCDGMETCDSGICVTSNIPCASEFCDETADSCQECVGDDDCFGGVCVNNLCAECANNTDCNNGAYCDGTETCDSGICVTSNIPCASEFCDETADTCQTCLGDDDCFGGVCVNNLCAECANNTDCNNGAYCDGTETCDSGICETSNIPCASEFCDETADSCQECVGDDDCFGGVCVNNLCAECANNTDCNNGAYCDGTETCDSGICETSNIPCASEFCDETADTCQECVADDDCFGGVCVNNLCAECANNTDCNNGAYCDGTETCNGGICVTSNIPCASEFCDETADSCQECVGDDDCFGGMCVNNLCAECTNNTDCDNGEYCDGTETCDAGSGACQSGAIPCAGDFCDEAADSCQECAGDDDCFGWFCVKNMCVECAFDRDCDNGLYCDGTETCDAGACVSTNDPCNGNTPACDERYDECVECLTDYDCDDAYQCENTECVPQCKLSIKYKAPLSEKLLKKSKKLNLTIIGPGRFDRTLKVAAGPLKVLKTKNSAKNRKLKVQLLIPQGTEPQSIQISVGDCVGEITIY